MREKGDKRKEKKILIRVNTDEKKLAEKLAREEGKNTSEFFRSLLHEHQHEKILQKHTYIINEHEQIIREYKKITNPDK